MCDVNTDEQLFHRTLGEGQYMVMPLSWTVMGSWYAKCRWNPLVECPMLAVVCENIHFELIDAVTQKNNGAIQFEGGNMILIRE